MYFDVHYFSISNNEIHIILGILFNFVEKRVFVYINYLKSSRTIIINLKLTSTNKFRKWIITIEDDVDIEQLINDIRAHCVNEDNNRDDLALATVTE